MKAVIPTFAPIPSSVPSIVPFPALFRSTKLWPISPAFRFRPEPELPVEEDRPADSRADPDRHDEPLPLRRSEARLAERRERARRSRAASGCPGNAGSSADETSHRSTPRFIARRSVVRSASSGPGTPRPIAGDVRPLGPGLRERGVGRRDERVGHLRGAAAERALHLPAAEDLPPRVDDARQDLRPAHVDAEDQASSRRP